MKIKLGAVGLVGWIIVSGCSSSNGDDTSATAGSAGTHAGGTSSGAAGGLTSSAGASTSAGASGTSHVAGAGGAGGAGATSGSTGASGAATGGTSGGMKHCTPGTTEPGINAFPYPLSNCGTTGKGALAGKEGYFDNIALDKPIGPGDTYAFSVDMMSADGTMELWGTASSCGDAVELLATAQAGTGIRCMTVSPKTGTYSNLIWAIYAAGTNGDVTFCPGGSCPN